MTTKQYEAEGCHSNYSGKAFAVLGMIFSVRSGMVPVVPLAGFNIAFLSTVYLFWAIRCPNCEGNLGCVATYYGLGRRFALVREGQGRSFIQKYMIRNEIEN